jgi:hypothetical protein
MKLRWIHTGQLKNWSGQLGAQWGVHKVARHHKARALCQVNVKYGSVP